MAALFLPLLVLLGGQGVPPAQVVPHPVVAPAQTPRPVPKPYNETAVAKDAIDAAVKAADTDDIRVLINWGANDDARCAAFARRSRRGHVHVLLGRVQAGLRRRRPSRQEPRPREGLRREARGRRAAGVDRARPEGQGRRQLSAATSWRRRTAPGSSSAKIARSHEAQGAGPRCHRAVRGRREAGEARRQDPLRLVLGPVVRVVP